MDTSEVDRVAQSYKELVVGGVERGRLDRKSREGMTLVRGAGGAARASIASFYYTGVRAAIAIERVAIVTLVIRCDSEAVSTYLHALPFLGYRVSSLSTRDARSGSSD